MNLDECIYIVYMTSFTYIREILLHRFTLLETNCELVSHFLFVCLRYAFYMKKYIWLWRHLVSLLHCAGHSYVESFGHSETQH